LEDGNPLALYDGLVNCERAGGPPPEWLLAELKQFVLAALTAASGDSRNLRSQRQRLAKKKRLHIMWEVRQWQKDKRDLGAFPFEGLPKLLAGHFDNYGCSVGDAAEIAASILEDTFAEASSETIFDLWRKRKSIAASLGNEGGFWETEVAFGLRSNMASVNLPRLQCEALEAMEKSRRDGDD
jgi:hypothetical protein